MRCVVCISIVFLLASCSKKNNFEVKFSPSDYVVDVRNRICYVEQNEVMGSADLNVFDSLLLVREKYAVGENFLHLYNKNTFEHLAYIGKLGKGPNEVIRQGYVNPNMDSTAFWLWDAGRDLHWLYRLDSMLSNPFYKPTEYIKVDPITSICRFCMVDDSSLLGIAFVATSMSTFRTNMVKFNLRNGAIAPYGHQYEGLSDSYSNSLFAYSKTHGIYVNAHVNCQLLSIFNLDGTLRCEVVGDDFGDDVQQRREYFGRVVIVDDVIVVEYNGDNSFSLDKHQRMETTWPTRLLVFDINGNHKATIETGNEICSFCIDEDNHRVICYFNGRENPLGYFNFDFEKELKN